MPRSTPTEVPRLDLAPKLNRPLSLWNPLDYLRLLYWVFYFPQALRWYVDTFGGGFIPEKNMSFKIGLEILRNNLVQRKLIIQSLFLTSIILFILAFGLIEIQTPVVWSGVTLGIVFSLLFSVVLSIIGGVGYGVAIGIAFGIFFGTTFDVVASILLTLNPEDIGRNYLASFTLSGSLASILGLSIALSLEGGIALQLAFVIALGLAMSAGTMTMFMIVVFTSLSLKIGAFLGGLILVFCLLILRIDSWILGFLGISFKGRNQHWNFGATTFLPLPNARNKISVWLKKEWFAGIHNTNELLAYSLQFFSVVPTLRQELALLPTNHLVYRISQIADKPYDWRLLRYVSASLIGAFRFVLLNSFPILLSRKRSISIYSPLQLDTPTRAIAAGFWLLHEEEPEAASQAFEGIRELLYGEEIYTLAVGLALFKKAETVQEIAGLEVPEYPKDPLLRPVTWKAMQRFCNVISDTKTVVGSVSRTSKAFASNRALGELQHILDYVDEVPEAERQLIEDIAKQWRDALLDVATSVGQQTVEQPIQNPYVVGDPVEGSLFVGRDDILRQLEELWLMGRQMQSVVLYGHRRMGKTSILRNAAKTVGAGLRLVYVNMLRSASAESLSDVLIAITDEISTELGVPAPSDEDMTANPTRTCDRYLKRVLDRLNNDETLIIAIDEFEKIEELIDTGKLSPDFIAYLRGLVQMSPKLGFAFAGLHTLEEMTQDYFNPFFASVIPIKVGFLPPGAVRQLLANPDPEFLLDYQAEAFDRIFQLTSGQPYLTQLVGFQLVRRYNNQVFEQASRRESTFSAADVDAVTEDPEFFSRGRYYFTGVWDQAGRDVPEQQAILRVLAPHADGLSLDDLQSATQLKRATLDSALELLDRHDVVKVENNQARILVALFRRWLLRQ